MKNTLRIIITIASICVSTVAWAQDDASVKDTKSAIKPSIDHTVLSQARAGEDAWLSTTIQGDWKLKEVWAGVRPLGSAGTFQHIPFKRTDSGQYVAILPGATMQEPGVEYFIASVDESGNRREHFASSQHPHTIFVEGETAETRRAARLARHKGQTSEFTMRGQFTNFGTSKVTSFEEQDGVWEDVDNETSAGADHYWETEVAYKHRPLGAIYDFSFGLGIMRGSSPFYTDPDGNNVYLSELGSEPGLNYGFGGATFEAHRNFSMEAKLVLGASDKGFAMGGGGLLRVGRIGGTRLELGGEAISDIGNTWFLKFSWNTIPRVPMGLAMEFTTMPDADLDRSGTRFVYELGWEVTDEITLVADAGVAARTSGLEVGYVGGLQAKYGF